MDEGRLLTVDRDAPAYAACEGDIAAAPEAVWALLADIDRWPQWNPDVKEARLDGSLVPGTTFVWKSGPGTIRSTLRLVDAPNRIGWTGKTLGINAVHIWTIEEAGGGSFVRTEESWHGLIVRLLAPMMKGQLQKAMDGAMKHLKAELDRRQGLDRTEKEVT